ncbi:MAG: hypothetical protein ABH971_01280 [bacterium]
MRILKNKKLVVSAILIWIILGFGISFRSNDQLCSERAPRDVYFWEWKIINQKSGPTLCECRNDSFGFPIPYFTDNGCFAYQEKVNLMSAIIFSFLNLIIYIMLTYCTLWFIGKLLKRKIV